MSNKPGVGTRAGSKSKLGVTPRKTYTRPVVEAEAFRPAQPVAHEVQERRNHYQKISTASYYRAERRGGHTQDWLEVKTDLDGLPGLDGAPYDMEGSDS